MTDAALFEVLRNRLWAINDEAVDAIVAVSGSPIATEGNDFNSGILTAAGEVALAGPYVLVHAAALGQVVRHVIEQFGDDPGIGPGDMFITNDTYVGAPHQPDVMVMAPVFRGDRLIAWCGSCVHQNDVGGPVPGSITVGATSIYEEAVPMAPTRIVEAGELLAEVEQEYLGRSRTPELNRLDLLGQIEANRVVARRLNGLCDRYGTDTVVAVIDGLIDRTEAAVRARLASLPDGRWRHRGLVEHDGIDDRVYEIGLTMTKQGDSLHLDFTDASQQAPALINTSRAITSSYAMAAVMTVLGYGLPWTPAGFWRVMEVETTPGTIVDCLWPAGMSMGVTAAGQEVRTAVNVCLSRMFDASDDPDVRNQILASCVSGSFTQTISGVFDDGRDFSAMLLDGLPGGAGARWGGDGPDTGGYLTSPAGLCTNIETNERHYPVLYRHRRERPDSGGPGRWRGGVGVEQAYRLHRASGPVASTVFAHGQQPPTAAGVVGGEPGMQHTGVYERSDVAIEVPPPKQVGELAPGDVYANLCGGGGGVGDPLDRDPAAVEHDVAEGLVTEAGAARDYGVILGDGAATEALRVQRRCERIGRYPAPPVEEPPAGRRLSSTVALADGRFVCRRCGHNLGSTTESLVSLLTLVRSPVDERTPWPSARPGAERFETRRLFCPACAVQVDVQVALADAPLLETAELIDP
ncbi:MAG: hydantoinase B/oxoprolinase family protein [bacterium]|nr:hydantoinase B/oxoprolinase family protein [bacterium]